jgi:hypothetical protein
MESNMKLRRQDMWKSATATVECQQRTSSASALLSSGY